MDEKNTGQKAKIRMAPASRATEILKELGYEVNYKLILRLAKMNKFATTCTGKSYLINIQSCIDYFDRGDFESIPEERRICEKNPSQMWAVHDGEYCGYGDTRQQAQDMYISSAEADRVDSVLISAPCLLDRLSECTGCGACSVY